MMDIVIDFLSQAAEILAANLSSSFSPFFLDYLELFLSRLKGAFSNERDGWNKHDGRKILQNVGPKIQSPPTN